jgi:hypothetical protein
MQYYVRGLLGNGEYKLLLDSNIGLNTFSLGGEWKIESQQAVAVRQASMNYKFIGGHLYAVLRPGSAKGGKISIKFDGKAITNALAGADVKNGEAAVDTDRLYDLVNLHGRGGEHVIEIDFSDGIELYTLTFG